MSSRSTTNSSLPAASRAFMNNLVLSKIANNLRPKNLLHLRLTSSAWNRAFIPTLRRRHRPIAVVKMPLHEYRPSNHMSEYTQAMKGSQQLPFARYEISTFTSNGDVEFNEFFTVCGPTMTSLKFSCYFSLRDDETDNLERMRRMMFELIPNLEYLDLTISGPVTQPEEPHGSMKMERDAGRIVGRVPKLKHLSFQTWNVGGPYLDQLYYLLEDLLLHATGLQNLHLLVSGFDFDGYHNLKALHALRDYVPHLDKIRTLTVLNATTAEVRVLLELAHGLRLEKLTVSVMSADRNLLTTLAEFRSFLVTQAPTLRHLDVTFGCGFGFGDLREPAVRAAYIQLPSLGIHTFKLNGMGHFNIQFEGGTLRNAFPNLQRLDLLWGLIAGHTEHTRIDICQLAHPKVTTLAITDLYPASKWTQDNDTRLEELAQMLPGVTSFEICIPIPCRPFDPFISRVIWMSWPALTVLDIKYSVDTKKEDETSVSAYLDEWLSGIPKSNFEILETELEYVLTKCSTTEIGTLQTLRNLSGAFKSLPGISDLQNLRRFSLTIKPKFLGKGKSSCSCNPTNLRGYLGLALASPTLQQLVIRCHKEFLSPECKSLIRFALGSQAVIEVGGNGPTDEENLCSNLLSELHDDLMKTHFW